MTNIDSLTNHLIEKISRKHLVCIGDSHSKFFSKIKNLSVFHIENATAYNLLKDRSTSQSKEKLFLKLSELSTEEAGIILSFGEIDLRVHVVKTALNNNITIRAATLKIVERYISAINSVTTLGFKVLIYGIHGSCPVYANEEYPQIGRVEDRNFAISIFNDAMCKFCNSRGFAFASLDDIVINSKNMQSRLEYMHDSCHLNVCSELQAVIISRFINSLNKKDKNSSYSAFNKNISERFNHGHGKKFLLTSSIKGTPKEGIVKTTYPYFFHTNKGFNQGIFIDLSAKLPVDEIIIENRTDKYSERGNSLNIQILDNRKPILTLKIDDDEKFLSGVSPLLRIKIDLVFTSMIAIYSTSETYLHFSNIQINGPYPLTG